MLTARSFPEPPLVASTIPPRRLPPIDPVTLHRDPAILRAITRERGARLGVYGSIAVPGPVAVGDPVELRP